MVRPRPSQGLDRSSILLGTIVEHAGMQFDPRLDLDYNLGSTPRMFYNLVPSNSG